MPYLLALIVFLTFSGKDNMFPSEDEGRRLSDTIGNCEFRCFKDNGHTLLMVYSNCQNSQTYMSLFEKPQFLLSWKPLTI